MKVETVDESLSVVDDLTLVELETYDPYPKRSGSYLRFKCPRHGGDNQRSLSVEENTGKFCCFNGDCAIWGTLQEFKDRRELGKRTAGAAPLRQAAPLPVHEHGIKRAAAAWKAYEGSPAQEYARGRGVPDNMAVSLRMGYCRGKWADADSEWLTFPLRCPVTGELTGVYGRNIHSDDQSLKGRLLGYGLFGATESGSLPADLVLVEGSFDALALLVSPGLPLVRALVGSSARAEWFDTCRRVSLLLDDDKPGQEAADRLVKDLESRYIRRGSGPRVFCMKKNALRERYNCKDMGELLRRGTPIRLALPPLEPLLVIPMFGGRPDVLTPDFEQAAARAYRAMLNARYTHTSARSALRMFVPRNDIEAAKTLLDAVTAGGDLDAAALILWFRHVQKTEHLPYEPFELAPGRRVEDPIGFYAALNEAIEAGPDGPWGEAVLYDLKLLAVATQPTHPTSSPATVYQTPAFI